MATSFDKFEAVFLLLASENSPGVLKVQRGENFLEVDVFKIGKYYLSSDSGKQYLIL